MKKINTFEDLRVWQNSRYINKRMYQILKNKSDKNSGFLINHMFKTSGSIMDNIAEGFERDGSKEFKNFLSYSKGSVGELRSQFYRALDINIISQEEFNELNKITLIIGKQLGSFMNYLKSTDLKGNKFHEPSDDYGLL